MRSWSTGLGFVDLVLLGEVPTHLPTAAAVAAAAAAAAASAGAMRATWRGPFWRDNTLRRQTCGPLEDYASKLSTRQTVSDTQLTMYLHNEYCYFRIDHCASSLYHQIRVDVVRRILFYVLPLLLARPF